MTIGPDVDPLSYALAPPAGETPAEREARIQAERDAKKRSDLIDQELNRQRAADKKADKPVKILLLGQSESGKSTTLKNFQLINNQKAFRAERPSWRAVVHLNVVRSIRLIVNALAEAEAAAASPVPPADDDPVYPPITPELLTLKMRLLPLQQVEEALLGKLTPGAKLSTAQDSVNAQREASEVYINSATPWKGAFSRLMNNVRSSVDGPEVDEPQDSRDARQLLHACSEDMIRLWTHPTVKLVLEAHRLRLEDMAGFFLDSIERVTALAYEPTDGAHIPSAPRIRADVWSIQIADDILKARLKTLGVSEHHFNLKAGNVVPQSWVVYDVGGARVPFFDSVDALIFLAPLSCFDQVLAEDETVNRLEDSILLWKTIVSSPLLKDTSLILFLNKCDILKAKLASGQKFAEYVVSYGERPNDFEHASQYMKKKFSTSSSFLDKYMGMWLTCATAMIAKQYSPEPVSFPRDVVVGEALIELVFSLRQRSFYSYFTAVTDIQSTKDILGSVRDMLVRQNLTRSRLV
ncbi:guanine nucleotide-binding protein alpha-4 subunit [Mycena metata]|uniref:Guanine nucleotide-binding protein alpha-4 subunit n=1 Tax=Mycena metata TaxID=1033252 RepID=A0AAD7KD12_9AGAR|nr:guanine nucleotide-binding protein alpha-4 subunit [Mycena metata]